ncbi:MAG: DUF5916 domain-containing protein [Acidobacteria bacterium]|nr:DUF5916 domain-containing protein [Acidobacteriota bacterium]
MPETTKSPNEKRNITLPPEKAVRVRITRFATPPTIDGRLDDAAWQQAATLKNFYQIQPGDNIAPSKPVEVLLGYDAKHLYIAFRASDESGKVRATVAKRDQIWEDDYVGMYLDTFNDRRRGYALFFNPLGVQGDGIMTETNGEDYSIDIVMESKGVVTEDGYTVEIAIPFKSLRYEVGKEKLWGAHFFRRIKRFNNELDSWMPFSRDKSGILNQAGQLTGIEEISTERTLELIPSLTISETGKRVRALPPAAAFIESGDVSRLDPGRIVNQPVRFDPGVTIKFSLTPTTTLDAAINPDFAQIEADQTVVTANQRFPIFFEEKRPFFFEGIDLFQTPLQAVHTRTIVDPDYALKLTGRRGRNSIGIMLASDNAPGNYTEDERNDPTQIQSIGKFLDKNAYIGILRLKRDIGKENNLGLIATSYNFIERHNQLGGFDGRFRLNPKTTFSFQVLGTTTRSLFFDPDAGKDIYRTGNGLGYSWNLDMSGRHFGYFIGGTGRTRDYRADVGFTRRTNTNDINFFSRYSSEPKPKATLISWRLSQFSNANYDFQGRLQNWITEPLLRFEFKRQTFFGIGFTARYERLFEEEFGAKRTETRTGAFFGPDPERSTYRKEIFGFGGMTPSKKYSFFLFGVYRWGEFDYDFGAGSRFPRVSPAALADPDAPLDPGPGTSLNMEGNFNYQPTDALRLSLSYIKSRLERYDTGRVAFDDNIYALRGTYQFTRFIFARARVDYTTLSSNVRGQFLFGWTPNPGTSFYLGYNDDLTRNGYSPFTGQLEPGFRRNGRTFFIKMSYLIRRSM